MSEGKSEPGTGEKLSLVSDLLESDSWHKYLVPLIQNKMDVLNSSVMLDDDLTPDEMQRKRGAWRELRKLLKQPAEDQAAYRNMLKEAKAKDS